MRLLNSSLYAGLLLAILCLPVAAFGQGVTTASITGTVTDEQGEPLPGANVIATHEPSGSEYGAVVRTGGLFDLLNLRIGGPYTVTVSFIGYQEQTKEAVYLNLAQTVRLDFQLVEEAIEMEMIQVMAEQDPVLNSGRTGAATYLDPNQVSQLPSIKRSTRDLTRLDPRSDGNFSFGGRNWLYNNISLDGSYFNNPFGLDDPAPGGQTAAEPVPFDAIEQVQVSVAPFDVREGGFTGAGINSVTKSGTNEFKGSIYSYLRNESLMGNKVSGEEVIADPSLSFNQSGFTVSGPIIPNKLFFFINGELERRDDPGTNFVADEDGNVAFGESRVRASTMDSITARMANVYDYETGPYQGFTHRTDNNKLIMKLDWNVNTNHNLSFRYNLLDAVRGLPPHGFVLSFNNTGRGPNSSSLPFKNSGYEINNELNSYALEINSTFKGKAANRFFFSYNRFRDFRDPFSEDFPTVEIGEAGVTYTTVGHEPFSIHNILDQDVFQVTDNFSYFMGKHVLTAGFNYERFTFFNSFNIFRHGVFFLPDELFFGGALGGTTFDSLDEFFADTDPDSAIQFRNAISTGLYKGEEIDVGQLSLYAQDEITVSKDLNVTAGLRIDIPQYYTEPVANPFSTDSLTLQDEKGNPETVDQATFPDATPLFSPRIGFNWDVNSDRSLQVRGGTGVFTGRLPFVWVGNVISNPGANPNLYPTISEEAALDDHLTDEGEGRQGELEGTESVLQQSFDLNAMDPDFKWPQVWTTDVAVDVQLPWEMLGTFEAIYGKDLNAIYMRNADLPEAVRTLDDGRPYYTDATGNFELNPDGGAGVYVIDNTDEGYSFTVTAQLRKQFENGLNTSLAYTYLQAKNNLKSTEIASVLWQNQPVQGDPNNPKISWSEFGNPHRIIASANYRHVWSRSMATSFGLFFEMAQGNRYIYSGGNRYSFIYSGDVNGDGYGGNDLIYIPENTNDINLEDESEWTALDDFIEQDDYLSQHRGEIAERFGAINPWFSNLDIRVLQDFSISAGGRPHTFQISLDILNAANLLSSDLGVRKVADPAALSPLKLVDWTEGGEPVFEFTGPDETYIDDPGEFSRWRVQLGLKYMF